MANGFTEALKKTLVSEGRGAASEPTDDLSFGGVRQNVYNSFAAQNNLPAKNVSQLSDDERQFFYKTEFYDRPKLDQLPPNISGAVFDFGVNAGSKTSIKVLQSLVGTKQDGLLGSNTLNAIDKFSSEHGSDVLVSEFSNKRVSFYRKLAKSNPAKYASSLPGWINRAKKFRPFDPSGGGFDYNSADAAGMTRDKNQHFGSLAPLPSTQAEALGLPLGSGLVLKGRTHKTWNKMVEAETKLGNKIVKVQGRYYSVPLGGEK